MLFWVIVCGIIGEAPMHVVYGQLFEGGNHPGIITIPNMAFFIYHCTFLKISILRDQAADIADRYNGAGIRLSNLVANATVYDCIFRELTAIGYGGALWLDTPEANLLRSCGEDSTAGHMGGFVHFGGQYSANSNRHATECSVFRCGQIPTLGDAKKDGGAAIATDRDLIKLASVNFSRCEARPQNDRMVAIAIAYDGIGDHPQLHAQYLLVIECQHGQAAIGLGKAEPSSISYTQFLNNSVSWVIQTYVDLNVTHCIFSDFGNLVSGLEGDTGTNPTYSKGKAYISECYFASPEFTGALIELTNNQFDMPVISLGAFSAGISYCPALAAQTLTDTPASHSDTPTSTPLVKPTVTRTHPASASLRFMSSHSLSVSFALRQTESLQPTSGIQSILLAGSVPVGATQSGVVSMVYSASKKPYVSFTFLDSSPVNPTNGLVRSALLPSGGLIVSDSFRSSEQLYASSQYAVSPMLLQTSSAANTVDFRASSVLQATHVGLDHTVFFEPSLGTGATSELMHSATVALSRVLKRSGVLTASVIFGSEELIGSEALQISAKQAISVNFAVTLPPIASSLFEGTGLFNVSAVWLPTDILTQSTSVEDIEVFLPSVQCDATAALPASVSFVSNGVLIASDLFTVTEAFSLSLAFVHTDVFASPKVSLSSVIAMSTTFTISKTFSAFQQISKSATLVYSHEESSTLGIIAAAIGGSLFALVVLGLLLLLLLFKRKIEETEPVEIIEEAQEVSVTTFDGDEDHYISEYGLSDGKSLSDTDEEGESNGIEETDMGALDDSLEMVSEHNPDELDFINGQDELV
jgi:hypothetical protein